MKVYELVEQGVTIEEDHLIGFFASFTSAVTARPGRWVREDPDEERWVQHGGDGVITAYEVEP